MKTYQSFLDDAPFVFDNEEGYGKYRYLVPLLIAQHRYEEATLAINDLETYAATLPDRQRDNLLDYCDYLTIAKDYAAAGYDAGIVKQNLNTLRYWAKTDNSPVQVPAQLLLEQAYPGQYDYPEKIVFPEKNRGKALVLSTNQAPMPPVENEDDILTVYPNPAKDKILVEYVNMSGNKEQTVAIYDMQGHKLKSRKVKEVLGIITFDVSGLPQGNYIVKCGELTKTISIVH